MRRIRSVIKNEETVIFLEIWLKFKHNKQYFCCDMKGCQRSLFPKIRYINLYLSMKLLKRSGC